MKRHLPYEELALLKKQNRLKKLSPRTHKIVHESGRSTKGLYRLMIEGTKSKKR